MTWTIVVGMLAGLSILLYPSTAQWLASYSQSQLIAGYAAEIENVNPDRHEQLEAAREYNRLLTSGVDLLANAHVPQGTGTMSGSTLDYSKILVADEDGLMARLRFPAADIDIPVYHGTADATLLKGAGHLEGTHLPVGGEGTRSVITGHRGLADATMFTHLDRVEEGDRFTIEVFGEVLTYEVGEIRVIEPEDTDSLRAVPGEDLVTLITCTPLGINTHRILVTGHRVTPTPVEDIQKAGAVPEIPGFPWWALLLGGGIVATAVFLWRAGYTDAAARDRRRKSEPPLSATHSDVVPSSLNSSPSPARVPSLTAQQG
jgi:sortase A